MPGELAPPLPTIQTAALQAVCANGLQGHFIAFFLMRAKNDLAARYKVRYRYIPSLLGNEIAQSLSRPEQGSFY